MSIEKYTKKYESPNNLENDFNLKNTKKEYIFQLNNELDNKEEEMCDNYNIGDNIRKYFTLNNNIYKKNKTVKLNENAKAIQKKNNIKKISIPSGCLEKKNTIKISKIKEEREQQIYGNIYQNPKINKNSNNAIQFFEEDQINQNIPIKTEPRTIYFKENYENKNGNNNQINSIFDYKDSYARIILLKKFKKRAIVPKPKNTNNSKRKIIHSNFIKCNNNSNELNIREIKSLDKLTRLRKKQETERIKNMISRGGENNTEIIEKFKNDVSNKRIINNKKFFTLESLNQKIKLLSHRIKSNENSIDNSISLSNENNNLNKTEETDNQMNFIMKPRINLNEIYNKDKRIINHSYIQSNSSQTPTYINAPKKSKIYYKKQIVNTKSFTNLNKINNLINAVSKKIKNRRNPSISYSNTNSLNFNNIKDKTFSNYINNNNSLSYYHILKNKTNYAKSHKMSNNNFNISSPNYLNNINQINYLNKYNSENSENVENIILKNEAINKIMNELDNDSLNKYRKENEKKLIEIKRNKNLKRINRKYVKLNLGKKMEESKNYFNQFDDNIYRTIDNQNIKNILNSQQLKMENSLDYYNKELELNNKKKQIVLDKFYENNKKNCFENKKNNKYSNIFEYDYNKYKMNKNNNEMFYDENNDIIGNFKFERKHKF